MQTRCERFLALQELLAVLYVDLSGYGLFYAATAEVEDGSGSVFSGGYTFYGRHAGEGERRSASGTGRRSVEVSAETTNVGRAEHQELVALECAHLLSGGELRGRGLTLEEVYSGGRYGHVAFGVSELDLRGSCAFEDYCGTFGDDVAAELREVDALIGGIVAVGYVDFHIGRRLPCVGAQNEAAIGIELNGYVFYFLKLEVGFFGSGVVASQAVNVGLTVLPKVNRCLLVALLQDDFVLAVGEFTEFYRSGRRTS